MFKLQANLDPRHRDRLAYIRVVSGRFEKGMKVIFAPTAQDIADSSRLENHATAGAVKFSETFRTRDQNHAPLILNTFPPQRIYICTRVPNGAHLAKSSSFSLCVQVYHSRMKGKQVTLAHAQQLFAQERETVLVSVS